MECGLRQDTLLAWLMPHHLAASSRNEVRVDAAIHILGILFAINASLWLLAHVTGLSVVVSVAIYCAGLLTMILASAAYQLWRHGLAKEILRRIDHARDLSHDRRNLHAVRREPARAWHRPRATRGYLAVRHGMILAVAKPLSAALASVDLWLLAAGGPVYSAGVIFFLTERLSCHKPVWHSFVLAVVVLQFAAIVGEFAT